MTSNLKEGDVVQIGPECGNPAFIGCFMIVTEPKSWGAQGYVQALGTRLKQGGQAYYREKHENLEFIGRAAFVVDR